MQPSKFENTIDLHRSQPTVTLERHVRKRRIELGTQISSRYRVYLDLKFWILFRDAELGRNKDNNVLRLLERIKYLVESNVAICPIAESVFVELLKQDDASTRTATAKLIDCLSLGVTLITHTHRVQQELCNSLYEQAGAKDLIPLQTLVWTKLSSVLGETHPSQTPFPPSEELVIQKAFYDHMWNISLTEMIKVLDISQMPNTNWQQAADLLNSENEQNSQDIKSFRQAYRTEFEGGLSLFKDEILALFREIEEAGYRDFCYTRSRLSEFENFLRFSRSVPTLHIGACCHAAVRWDRKRKLTGNDFFDFHHAEAALAYCNLFLTEKSLKTLLSQKHLDLIEHFPCKIASSPSSALDIVGEIEG